MIGIAIYLRKLKTVVVLCCIVAFHGYTVLVAYLPINDSIQRTDDTVALRVMNINLLYSNEDYQSQMRKILENEPDVIAFQEYSSSWHEKLKIALSHNYPHSRSVPISSPFGIALYSKYPIVSGGPVQFAPGMTYAIDAVLNVDDHPVRVLAVHPPPPISTSTFDSRNATLNWIAEESRAENGALVVAGDLNSSQWTTPFIRMEKNGKLRHAGRGFGLQPTWPSSLFILLVPIDHILVNNKIAVNAIRTGKPAGSDHHSITADLTVFR